MVDIIDNLKTKIQTRFFLDKEVDKELILNALKAAHTYVPSRDNKVPYKIKVLGPTEEDWKYKEKLYSHTRCGNKWSDEDFFIFNEQVLAPYVVCFYETDNFLSKFELGMFAITFLSECTRQGLDVGFCGSFSRWIDRPLCALGIGYRIKTADDNIYNEDLYRHKIWQKRKRIPFYTKGKSFSDGRWSSIQEKKSKGYIKWEHWK